MTRGNFIRKRRNFGFAIRSCVDYTKVGDQIRAQSELDNVLPDPERPSSHTIADERIAQVHADLAQFTGQNKG